MKEHAETTMPALSRRAFVGTAAVTAGAVAATSLVGCGSTGGKKTDKQEEAAARSVRGRANFLFNLSAGVPAPQPKGICHRRQNRQSRIL